MDQKVRLTFDKAVLTLRKLYLEDRWSRYVEEPEMEEAYDELWKAAYTFAEDHSPANEAILDAWARVRLPIFEPQEVLDKLRSTALAYRDLHRKGSLKAVAERMRLVEVIRTNEERSLSNFRKYFSETQAKLA